MMGQTPLKDPKNSDHAIKSGSEILNHVPDSESSDSATGLEPETFDAMVHLLGEQKLPNLQGILQFKSKLHLFLITDRYTAKSMNQFLGNSKFQEIKVGAYDPLNVRNAILAFFQEHPQYKKIGFNLTSGTKLMFAGALDACKELQGRPIYFNGSQKTVQFLDTYDSHRTIDIDDVETYIKLNANSLQVSESGKPETIRFVMDQNRRELTMFLWDIRQELSREYKGIIEKSNNNPGPFLIEIQPNIRIEWHKDQSVTVLQGRKPYQFPKWEKFNEYLCGKWLEEYVYLKLQPYVEQGLIRDLRLEMKVSIQNLPDDEYQEFDLVLTNGSRLYILECKAGGVKSDNIMKLQNVTRQFGGSEGMGLLLHCFPVPRQKYVVNMKLNDSHNLKSFSGNNMIEDLVKYLYSVTPKMPQMVAGIK